MSAPAIPFITIKQHPGRGGDAVMEDGGSGRVKILRDECMRRSSKGQRQRQEQIKPSCDAGRVKALKKDQINQPRIGKWCMMMALLVSSIDAESFDDVHCRLYPALVQCPFGAYAYPDDPPAASAFGPPFHHRSASTLNRSIDRSIEGSDKRQRAKGNQSLEGNHHWIGCLFKTRSLTFSGGRCRGP